MATKKTAVAAVEMVDIVDKDDKVVKTVERTVAEDTGARLRGVHVYLADEDGNFVVQWRLASKKTSPRMFTASAAGMVGSGEGYDLCAKRELQEELGVKGKLELLGSYQTKAGNLVNGQAFLAKWDGDMDALVGWEAEAEGLDVWSLEEADFMLKRFPYLLAPTFRESLKIYLKKMK